MMIGGEPAKCAHEAAWMPGRTECGPCEDARGMAKLRREVKEG